MTAIFHRSPASDRIGHEPWAGIYQRGLQYCRQGQWELGLGLLMRVSVGVRRPDLPGLFYSFLGYGAARCHGEVQKGLRLCQRAIRLEFYQPENYLNLARTHLLTRDRQAACDTLARGLLIDPTHPGLLQLQRELGQRRPPVFPFLSRHSLLNRLAGKVRHDVFGTSRNEIALGKPATVLISADADAADVIETF